MAPGASIFPNQYFGLTIRGQQPAGRDCANGYRFAKWHGKPNPVNQPKPL
jgi:hypothetical protein